MELSGHTIAPAVIGRRVEGTPDGSMIVYQGVDDTGMNRLWLRPRSQLEARPIPGTEIAGTPAFSPDGQRIAFITGNAGLGVTSLGGEPPITFPAPGNTAGGEVLDDARDVVAAEVSRDGAWLLYRTNALQDPGADILARRLDADGHPEGEPLPLLTTPAQERAPTLSPDGRWLAYVSDASGRDQIYVRPFPDVEGARWQVSVEGATEPLWSRGGGEIFYRRSDGDLVAVEVRTDPTFSTGQRHALFPSGGYSVDYNHRGYDVLPGDTTFVFFPLQTGGGDHLVVVENLLTELEEKEGR